MKKNLSFLVVIFSFLLLPAVHSLYAQKAFEGTITWSMTVPMMGDDDPHPMVVNIKGQKSETEMDLGAMGLRKSYIDYDSGKIYMVMGSSKTGFVSNFPSDADIKKLPAQLDSMDLKPTGNKQTISGHPAEEYLITGLKIMGQNVDMSVWVSSNFPEDIRQGFYHTLKSSSAQDPKLFKALKQLAAKGLVPVRTETKQGGQIAMTMEFVKYEPKSLNDALFVPPADVKFGPMPKMPGGMN
jgi:Domain of unknown function (DUF4412)